MSQIFFALNFICKAHNVTIENKNLSKKGKSFIKSLGQRTEPSAGARKVAYNKWYSDCTILQKQLYIKLYDTNLILGEI